MATVVVHFEDEEVYRSPLKNPAMIIGRDKSADIHLDNRALSRNHARLEKKGAAIWIADLESQNGTHVNGKKITEPQLLHNEDLVEVGRYRISVEGVEEASPDQPVIKLAGPEGEHRFLMMDDELVIGRSPSSDIAIAHKSISRKHVRITNKQGQFFIEDLGSQNGTTLNGQQLTEQTAFSPNDLIQMSEFSIELSFMKNQDEFEFNQSGDQANKTMMIDRSELAKAAYIDGDLEHMASASGRLALGREENSEHGAAATSGHELLKQTASIPAAAPPPISASKPEEKQPPAPPQKRLLVTHPDSGEREIILEEAPIALSEDGQTNESMITNNYADQAYLVFMQSGDQVVASVVGDRRLAIVNGEPKLYAILEDGDTVEIGLLSTVFKS
jgi:pSer/pThr/pTyr-binding forkhead associated (FHA) protein